ncbi:hypothetical protein IFM89_037171 [Coptis chinensis]|uniref:Uncharacterized protein n=1 Tax=Coptis chinensis TaxID=261450 RepID=A0A835M5Z3_9MAGN|nr:hypothetical protein IFM89_037171 [Coptis chinensis]
MEHKFGFGVTNALDVWYIDANLHIWLDSKSVETKGNLIEYKSPIPAVSLVSNFSGLDGTFLTKASRSIYSSGWVESYHGKVYADGTHSFQEFSFTNFMRMGENGSLQIEMAVTLQSRMSPWALKNVHNGQGSIVVKGNLVTSGLGSTQQVYNYDGTGGCFFRNVNEFSLAIKKEEQACEISTYGGKVKAPKVLADIVEPVAAAKQGKNVDIKHWRNGENNITNILVDGKLLASACSEQKETSKLSAAKAALEKMLISKSS